MTNEKRAVYRSLVCHFFFILPKQKAVQTRDSLLSFSYGQLLTALSSSSSPDAHAPIQAAVFQTEVPRYRRLHRQKKLTPERFRAADPHAGQSRQARAAASFAAVPAASSHQPWKTDDGHVRCHRSSHRSFFTLPLLLPNTLRYYFIDVNKQTNERSIDRSFTFHRH